MKNDITMLLTKNVPFFLAAALKEKIEEACLMLCWELVGPWYAKERWPVGFAFDRRDLNQSRVHGVSDTLLFGHAHDKHFSFRSTNKGS